jgi:hypothetical protein
VDDEEDLQTLGTLEKYKFRNEYLNQVKKLIKFIYSHVTPKVLFNNPLNGKGAFSYFTCIHFSWLPF